MLGNWTASTHLTHTHTHQINATAKVKLHSKYVFEGFGHIQSQGPKMLKRKPEVKNRRKAGPRPLPSATHFHLCFTLFFSSFSCCNWLYYEMKVINAVLSLAVSTSDWAQQSPNYHRRTHQCWPTIPSHSMQLCLCTHVWRRTHIDFR